MCAQDHEADRQYQCSEMLRHFEKMIDKWARLLNIQKLQSIKSSGREYHLITLMGLREVGERHHDFNGGDPDVSAKAMI